VTGQAYPQTLAELIEFNEDHPGLEGPWNNLIFELAEATNGRDQDCAEIRAGVTPPVQAEINKVMADNNLDAIIALTNGPAWPTNSNPAEGDLGGHFQEFFVGSSTAAAVSGYADITVPAGYVAGLPIGITFIGGPWAEPQLLGFAYDYEQATKVRVPPQFIPTIGDALFPDVPNPSVWCRRGGSRRPTVSAISSCASGRGMPRRQRSPAIRPGFVPLVACSHSRGGYAIAEPRTAVKRWSGGGGNRTRGRFPQRLIAPGGGSLLNERRRAFGLGVLARVGSRTGGNL
jgi:Amidase